MNLSPEEWNAIRMVVSASSMEPMSLPELIEELHRTRAHAAALADWEQDLLLKIKLKAHQLAILGRSTGG